MWHVTDRLQKREGMLHLEEVLELTSLEIRALRNVAQADQQAALEDMMTRTIQQLVAKVIRRVVAEVRTNPAALKENESYSLSVVFSQTEEGDWLSTAEVAELYQVSQQQVRRWCESGKLRNVRTPGGTYRISKADVSASLRPADESAESPVDISQSVGAWTNNEALAEEIRQAAREPERNQ